MRRNANSVFLPHFLALKHNSEHCFIVLNKLYEIMKETLERKGWLRRYSISQRRYLVGVENHVLRYWEDELHLEIPRDRKINGIIQAAY